MTGVVLIMFVSVQRLKSFLTERFDFPVADVDKIRNQEILAQLRVLCSDYSLEVQFVSACEV